MFFAGCCRITGSQYSPLVHIECFLDTVPSVFQEVPEVHVGVVVESSPRPERGDLQCCHLNHHDGVTDIHIQVRFPTGLCRLDELSKQATLDESFPRIFWPRRQHEAAVEHGSPVEVHDLFSIGEVGAGVRFWPEMGNARSLTPLFPEAGVTSFTGVDHDFSSFYFGMWGRLKSRYIRYHIYID